jgi:putative transposase
MHYRRLQLPGWTYFFTVVTHGRRPILGTEAAVSVMREAFRSVRATRPFTLDAIVILPDHLHCLWTLPENDADYTTRWRLVKTWFTKHASTDLRGVNNPSSSHRGEQPVWQHRYWEHAIRDEQDYARHLDYIHWNPVKHGYAASPAEWPYSSFQRFVAAGLYPANWGGEYEEIEGVGHE